MISSVSDPEFDLDVQTPSAAISEIAKACPACVMPYRP